MKKSLILLLCSLLLVFGVSAKASALNLVQNPSFEAEMTGQAYDGTTSAELVAFGPNTYNNVNPLNWNLYNDSGGTFWNSNAQFPLGSGLDGNQFAWLNSGLVSQIMDKLSAGEAYRFGYSVGFRPDLPSQYSFPGGFAVVKAVRNDSSFDTLYYLDNFGTVHKGTFNSFSGVFVAPDSSTYDYLMVELGTNGIQIAFDNVSLGLTEAPPPAVPEPATMFLLGSGLIGLAGFARRRFKK